jgi:predicted choloylglycine hydrolase
VDISTVSEHKHLGLVISENGSWEKHTDMITAYKRINILRKFKFILDRKTLEKIYFAFVRPLLEYADVIWDNMSISLNKNIENVQLEASRIVTGGTRLVSHNNLYMETGWEKLEWRICPWRLPV